MTGNGRLTKDNISPATQKMRTYRERRKRGVVCVLPLELMPRDLEVLRALGFLPSSEPEAVAKDDVADAMGSLLDALSETPHHRPISALKHE